MDTRQKRAAVIGTARAWYRNPHPSSLNAAQRASVGQVYPVAEFSEAVPVVVIQTGTGGPDAYEEEPGRRMGDDDAVIMKVITLFLKHNG